MRFDNFVAQALKISRNKAQNLIKEGKILLNGEILGKVSAEVASGEISATDEIFVSRGALKLKGFLDECALDITGVRALDIGSSTGGFVQILLKYGASEVVALDVGSAQLDDSLRCDPRVIVRENTDIREFESQTSFELITCDVSFIGIEKILPSILRLASRDIILLFKPQFEVGVGAKRDKKGVIKNQKPVEQAMAKFELNCAKMGLIMIQKLPCQIKGKEGNQEFFYHYKKGE